jgi:hypothetical protein
MKSLFPFLIIKSPKSLAVKGLASFLLLIMLLGVLAVPKDVQAQAVVVDPAASAQRITFDIKSDFWRKTLEGLTRAASISFHRFLKTSLNKIAYDTATYIGSGDRGQKPLFVTEEWDVYLKKVADQAGGEAIQTFVNAFADSWTNDIGNTKGAQKEFQECTSKCGVEGISECYKKCQEASQSKLATSTPGVSERRMVVNVCQPSSLQAGLKISLGLAAQSQPGAPKCTATELIKNWGDGIVSDYQKFTNINYLNEVKGMFNPISNDLGIFTILSSDLMTAEEKAKVNKERTLVAGNGWLDVRKISGELIGSPNAAERQALITQQTAASAFLMTTGDIVVDSANVFLNQLALTSFNRLMANLGDLASRGTSSFGSAGYDSDPNVTYKEAELGKTIAKVIAPNYQSDSDYDVLIKLSTCPDPSNPGPNECVIDDRFLEAITKKKTIAQAMNDGSLNPNWRFVKEGKIDAQAFSARNIDILIKHRILPTIWAEIFNKLDTIPEAKEATLRDLVSCYAEGDEYSGFSNNFNPQDTAWCKGLVDPHWVLKAPLTYCAKKGIGSQIVSSINIPGSSQGGVKIASVYNISRASDYCADEQTCIQEDGKGNCDYFGYCNEERRTWEFDSASCEPVYNTCETFTNETSRQRFSFLENTLNYGNCDADNAGCAKYLLTGSYASTTNLISWSNEQGVYLTKADDCSQRSEGCTELIRVKPTWGANLITSTWLDEEEVKTNNLGTGIEIVFSGWPIAYSQNSAEGQKRVEVITEDEETEIHLSTTRRSVAAGSTGGNLTAKVYSSPEKSLLPNNFSLIPGESYTLTADVYLEEGDRVIAYLGSDALSPTAVTKETLAKGAWQTLRVTRRADSSYQRPEFGIMGLTASGARVSFSVSNVKFEVSNVSSDFSIYGNYRVYQKLIPPYLENVCYKGGGNYELKEDAPSICLNFTRQCNASEVGCESFTSVKNQVKVTAQVTGDDYCNQECVGYNLYFARANYFNPVQAENIIPANLTACSAAAVGCNEFTNLDSVRAGGEGREYYQELRQCIKPNPTECDSFYSWEVTKNGSQLKLFTLQKDQQTGGPKTVIDDRGECNEEIYKKKPGDPLYNSDCREFYDTDGKIFYHLLSKTITCSENCLTYRMTEKNIDQSKKSEASCQGSDGNWDNGNCYICLNGGQWDESLKACTYQAIPGEGKACSAAAAGCREYSGSNGNNIKNIYSFNFDNGLQGWESNCSNGVTASQVSNNRSGGSMLVSGTIGNQCSVAGLKLTDSTANNNRQAVAQLPVGQAVTQGKSYNLRFMARSERPLTLLAYFSNANPETGALEIAEFNEGEHINIKGGNSWQIYELTLQELDHQVSAGELLVIGTNNDGEYYLDDLVLTEISDRYYLIKDSGRIPNVCYFDVNGEYRGDSYNLGCSLYTDRDNQTHSLLKFSKLCANSSVGCEQMIRTQNSASPEIETWNGERDDKSCQSGDKDCVTVPADETIYAVYDRTKSCGEAEKGCQLTGRVIDDSGNQSDEYKKIDPDKFRETICGPSALGCSAWSSGKGTVYFKNPGNNYCEYRTGSSSAAGKNWYEVRVNRCDMNNNGRIDANERQTCRQDQDCGGGKCILDKTDRLCAVTTDKTFGYGGLGKAIDTPADKVGLCTTEAASCSEYLDPVSAISATIAKNDGTGLVFNLETNKLYSISFDTVPKSKVELKFSAGVRQLLENNSLRNSTTTISLTGQQGAIVHTGSARGMTMRVTGTNVSPIVKEVIINYQLSREIETCESPNLDNGCILFNERKVSSGNSVGNLSYVSNNYNAFASEDGRAVSSCNSGDCTANKLIKVAPNRECSRWLDCLSYGFDEKGEKVCYAIGECTQLEEGECVSWVETSSDKQGYDEISRNASGYTMLDRYNLASMQEVGLNSDVHYDFEELMPYLSCQQSNGQSCNINIYDYLIREKQDAPNNIEYPAHGKSFLKVPQNHLVTITPDSGVKLEENQDYYLNYLVNTSEGTEGIIRLKTGNKETSIVIPPSAKGWERRIYKFNTGSSNTINITLSVATSDSGNASVYFDDLNIEPVLEVGPNQYVAKECRLYPTDDSFTCVNQDDGSIKNGLEGYCLKHDQYNKNVCLVWYPLDKISASRISENIEGYQGVYPLNYCALADGNFDLVKKVTAQPMALSGFGKAGTIRTGVTDGSICAVWENEGKDGKPGWNTYSTIGKLSTFWSTPRNESELFQFLAQARNFSQAICSGNYRPAIAIGEKKGMTKSYFKIMCLPSDTAEFLLPEGGEKKTISNMDACDGYPYQEGWIKYDGTLVDQEYVILGMTEKKDIWFRLFKNGDGVVTYNGASFNIYEGYRGSDYCTEAYNKVGGDPWCQQQGGSNYMGVIEGSIDNPVRVLDYNAPPASESGLKLINGNDPDKNFKLTCNNFIELVDSYGNNQAFADRVSLSNLEYSTSTPEGYFKATYLKNYGLDRYGRNIDQAPFGAASLPSDFNFLNHQGAVKFRDQYSAKNKEDVFAGRPYGCSGSGCDNIGYCSLNPNVYCLLAKIDSKNREGERINLEILGDDYFQIYLNGKKSGEYNKELQKKDLVLKKGINVIAVQVKDAPSDTSKENRWGLEAAINGKSITSGTEVGKWFCAHNQDANGLKENGHNWYSTDYDINAETNYNTVDNLMVNKWEVAIPSVSKKLTDSKGYGAIWAAQDNNDRTKIKENNLSPTSEIFCRYTIYVGEGQEKDTYVSSRTCSEGGYGTCVPLWDKFPGSVANEPVYKDVLSSFFRKSYNFYSYNPGLETYTVVSGKGSDDSISGGAVKPKVTNFKFNGGAAANTNNATINVATRGLYKLEFNTEVNKSQQPLKQIIIDWGDGRSQTIVGQDNRPQAENPHIFYHYYNTTGPMSIKIKLIDNWEITS